MPSGLSTSAWRTVTVVPAGPVTDSRSTPLKFWPRSATHTPGFGCVHATGLNSCCTVTPLSTWDTRFGLAPVFTRGAAQARSSNPGRSQPAAASRASYVSPW